MRRIYAVLELRDSSPFDPSSDDDLDVLADDLLRITEGVAGVTVYSSLSDLQAEEAD